VLLGEGLAPPGVGHRLCRPRDDRDARLLHDLSGGRLLPESLHRRTVGPDPRQSLGVLDTACEPGVLREKAVAGVDGVGAGLDGGLDDPFPVEVGLTRRRRPHVVGFLGVPDVPGRTVGVAVDGDGVDAEFIAGCHHSDGDLAPVGHEQFLEHQ